MKDKYVEQAFKSLGFLYDGSIVSVADIDAEIDKNRALTRICTVCGFSMIELT